MSVTGLDKLNARMRRIPARTREALRVTLDQEADRLVNLQKALAPVDDGDLKDTIRTEPGRHDLAVDVVAGGPKTTRPVREGVTSPAFDYAAQAEADAPFFYPAWRALRKSIRSRIARAVSKAAKGNAQ